MKNKNKKILIVLGINLILVITFITSYATEKLEISANSESKEAIRIKPKAENQVVIENKVQETENKVEEKVEEAKFHDVLVKGIDIDKIIKKNEEEIISEKIEKKEVVQEYVTQYRENSSLARGKIQTLQQGQDGRQNSVVKMIYKNDELVSQNVISADIIKASIDKVVEVGTGPFTSSYVPIVGDSLKVTSYSVALLSEPKLDSTRITTLNKDATVKLQKQKGEWYLIKYDNYEGYAPKDCFVYYDENKNGPGDSGSVFYTKEQLTSNLGISMLLNKKSGLTLNQYKKIFENDPNDKEGVFKNLAEYFYYAEEQYNINGLFVAAIGIHESGWGTSALSKRKKNLFGYGAYDRDPSGMAVGFEGYAQGIDLVSRVLVKYYLNPKGTPIYGGEIAEGTYYKGSTLTAVNQSYASDKEWANKVYRWMMYLYSKID